MTVMNQKDVQSLRDVKSLTKVAVLGVIAFFIMAFEFPLPFFASFLKIDFSDVPALLAGFALGPWAGAGVEVLKNILHAIFKNQTAFIGEAANLLTGILFVVPASYVYWMNKNRNTAIIGMLLGTIVMAVGMSLANYFVFIPLYQKVLNIPMDVIVSLGTKANPRVVDLKTLIVYSILPFNILKGLMLSLVTLLIYKRISILLHR
ncbi:MAG: ECF transporter S component [Thermovenabulum sp.]|uniref:ECF transporter S component n=1 Tax=Thermovenabulum sp. TaxID=3100335 RepID=UPI003C7BE141